MTGPTENLRFRSDESGYPLRGNARRQSRRALRKALAVGSASVAAVALGLVLLGLFELVE
jgi:hypothetical protein